MTQPQRRVQCYGMFASVSPRHVYPQAVPPHRSKGTSPASERPCVIPGRPWPCLVHWWGFQWRGLSAVCCLVENVTRLSQSTQGCSVAGLLLAAPTALMFCKYVSSSCFGALSQVVTQHCRQREHACHAVRLLLLSSKCLVLVKGIVAALSLSGS
jgi:hypothetical protein